MRLMNLMKKKWLVWAGCILLCAIMISLGIVQIQQSSKKTKISEELEKAEKVLSALETEQSSFQNDELDTQLDETRNSKDTAIAKLSQPADSIIASEALFAIAEANSVTLTSMATSPISTGTLAELPCYMLSLNFSAEGNIVQLLDFIVSLNTDLTNGVVRSASLTVSEESGEYVSTVDIGVVIYTYQEDSDGQEGSLSIY